MWQIIIFKTHFLCCKKHCYSAGCYGWRCLVISQFQRSLQEVCFTLCILLSYIQEQEHDGGFLLIIALQCVRLLRRRPQSQREFLHMT